MGSFLHLVVWFSLFHLTVSNLLASSMRPLCHDNEQFALLQFKASFVINKSASSKPSAYPKVASWKLEEGNGDRCLWDGVKCNEETGHVIRLDLSSSCLYGSINSTTTLFHLVHLQWLSLADNDFNHSQIPSQILELSQLEFLDLSHNKLKLHKPSLKSLVEKLTNLKVLKLIWVHISSPIPHNLANLSSLTYLSLAYSGLEGELPRNLSQLSNLQFMDVQSNYDLIGYLPNSIGDLKFLSHLDVNGCRLSGTIPPSLGNLTELVYLDLSSNNFSGQVPNSLSNLIQLNHLDISCNGGLVQNSYSPSWMSKLNKLTFLSLSNINLVGEIPSWLMNLTQLTNLKMNGNQLIGQIPDWLMSLNQLSNLQLMSNKLTGHIPSQISNLTHLKLLQLGSNRLQSPIHSSIFDLKKLQFLDLGSNNLSGPVELDVFFHKLKSLRALQLSANNLSVVTKTTTTSTLQKFILVGLSSCNLSKFPNFLQNQHQLLVLDLSFNRIAGQIPEWFLKASNFKALKSLNLSHNLLTGFDQNLVVLPWSVLQGLDLRFNKLQGPLPVPPMSVSHYLVSNNKLTGEIPPWICSLKSLYALDLSYNNLSGELPRCLGNFSYELSLLKLQSNKFHGSIPGTFMHGTNLRMIDLSYNLLQGKIPRSLADCTMLEFLDLGNNHIEDIFPSWLGNLPELKVLILQSNKFHGVIRKPETGCGFSQLRIIDLSCNRFTGKLPSKYFKCWNAMKVVDASELIYMEDTLSFILPFVFSYNGIYDYSLTMSNKGMEMEYQKVSNLLIGIILSSNRFMGEIPASIANLKGLHVLDLSNNSLGGHIPSSLGDLKELESLDVSNNRFFGKIPQRLVELTFLGFINVSNNRLTGPIPQGTQFDTFNSNSFGGNLGLCGRPLSEKCEDDEASKKKIHDTGTESSLAFDWRVVALMGYGSGLIIGVALGITFVDSKWFALIFRRQLQRLKRKSG